MIYHVVKNTDWQKAIQQGVYKPQSLTAEGFIHTSKASQVAGVLERYYKNEKDLLLLYIDEHALQSAFTYEFSESVNEEFPHIYGPLNLDAVIKTEPI